MAAGADDEDVYATSDAAWLTEADSDTGDDGDTPHDSDTDDGEARGAPVDDEMTDDAGTDAGTTATDTARTEPGTDTTGTGTTTGSETSPAATASTGGSAAADRVPTTSAKRPGTPRGGKGRAKRPAGAGARIDGGRPDTDRSDSDRPDAARPGSDPAGAAAAESTAAATVPTKKRAPRSPAAKRPQAAAPKQPVVLRAEGLVKRYGHTLAVDEVDLEIRQGSIFGVVGPNGAGKTTTLSMVTGLLRPDAGTVTVLDHDVWADPTAAKRSLGVLPDRLRLFDRLTGGQLLYYSATLRGLDGATARERSADLAEAFGLGEALGRQVADYSVGMAKKIALAATLIHSPRVLVLDEPFESVDPVSAATITEILRRYTAGGGTVVLSSHSMELVQRTCDSVAIIVGGKVLASGTMAQVRGRKSLEDKFVELAGGRVVAESMEWLHSFSG
ncbi:ABC transporter ATP-binding protein [Curtobacterium sp. DN_7.5]|uniref:ABC transporter ATP-binding protein n=1 Tax=Curtobacterium sp. DN_7.5 TaxID=3049047 RepID=UPI001F5638BB|nr:ABC transporter ATP-binding protein [Curtobacterium sp. DN_7.5]